MVKQLTRFTIEYEQEEDGRWLAEVIELPGVLAYGRTPEDAMAKAQALGLRVLADRIEHGEEAPRVGSPPAHWLEYQTSVWLASSPLASWLAGCRVCLS